MRWAVVCSRSSRILTVPDALALMFSKGSPLTKCRLPKRKSGSIISHPAAPATDLQAGYRQRRMQTVLAIAASILIVVGVAGWALFFKQKGPPVVQTAVLDLRNRSVPRGGELNPGEQPLELSRAVKHLNVYLPLGSAEGPYELRIATTTGSAIFTTNGVASLKDGVTSMEAALDLSSAPSGRYVLQIRRPNSEWNSYPLLLR